MPSEVKLLAPRASIRFPGYTEQPWYASTVELTDEDTGPSSQYDLFSVEFGLPPGRTIVDGVSAMAQVNMQECAAGLIAGAVDVGGDDEWLWDFNAAPHVQFIATSTYTSSGFGGTHWSWSVAPKVEIPVHDEHFYLYCYTAADCLARAAAWGIILGEPCR